MYADENFNDDPSKFVRNCNEMVILSIDLNNLSLDNNFDKFDPDTIYSGQTFGFSY